MKYKYAFALLLLAGLAFAIQPAEDWNVGDIGRYTQVGQATFTTMGGNVTELNLSSNISTAKWAGFWGNVSGEIVLAPNNVDMFYTWAWDSTDGGEVCAVTGPTFSWFAVQPATGGDVDWMWFFDPDDTDSGNNTLSSTCEAEVAGIYIPATNCTTTGSGVLETFVIADMGMPLVKSDLAFCVNITGNTALFNGQTGDYELLTPTNETAGSTETYYFWLELN